MSTDDNKALVRRFFEQGFKEAAQGNLTHLHNILEYAQQCGASPTAGQAEA